MINKTVEFKAELKALLEKYNVTISVKSDSGSDWHGITGEQMAAFFKSEGTSIVLANGLDIDASDI